MGKSRISKRREAEAVEAIEKASAKKKKKKTTTKKTTRKKSASSRSRRAKNVLPRRRLLWVIYSSTMREEGRYLYHERKKAEDKLKLLLAKGKRRYFIQPIKEALDSEGRPLIEELTSEKVAPAKLADSDAAESSDESDE